MPTYVYKAMTKSGVVVKNKVDSPSRNDLLRKLKENNLVPIDVEQIRYANTIQTTQVKKKKNINETEDIMKNVNTTNLGTAKTKTTINKRKIEFVFSSN